MKEDILINFLENQKVPTFQKKRHTYLTYQGISDPYAYILKEGIVKTSIILKDGREFNFSYINKPDVVSLLHDEVSKYTSAPFNVRVESEVATFYKIQRVTFWNYINENPSLQQYIKDYYRNKLQKNIRKQQEMIMNGKKGALCALLIDLLKMFGRPLSDEKGILIDFPITNEELAGFCGISTRNSVNRMLKELKEANVIEMKYNRICILNKEYLLDNVPI